ncbi:MAG: hypothetical protein LBB14_03840 [Puniceicoccales bacterium]|jgi:hypothetical protein|nr:hypothetical protein [Puniceicoccales bacterium]
MDLPSSPLPYHKFYAPLLAPRPDLEESKKADSSAPVSGALDPALIAIFDKIKTGSLSDVIAAFGGREKCLELFATREPIAKSRINILLILCTLAAFLWCTITNSFHKTERNEKMFFRANATYALPSETEKIIFSGDYGAQREELIANAAKSTRTTDCAIGRQQLTLEEAAGIGLLFTDEETECIRENPQIRIAPCMISYGPMTNFRDGVNCMKNLGNKISDEMIAYAEEYHSLFSEKIKKHNDEVFRAGNGTFLCPVFSGFSKGGMVAHALGVKFGRMSVGFNPLGHGDEVKEFAGIDSWKTANGEQKRSHVSIIIEGDWVSDPQYAYSAFYRPPPGERYIIENKVGKTGTNALHNSYQKNFDAFRRELHAGN